MCLSSLICWPWTYGSSLKQLYPPYLAQMMGLWVTCGVKMMSLCYGWGWQPRQTASRIHNRHIQCVWAWWYAIHRHMVAPLHIYTHPTWLRIWGSGSLVESKWCHYVMVEANGHTSICFPHPYLTYRMCLSTLIRWPWAYGNSLKQSYPPYLAQMLGLWVTCGVIMMYLCHGWGWPPHLKLLLTSILDICNVFEHVDMLSVGIW
jgi:hypothetical protein